MSDHVEDLIGLYFDPTEKYIASIIYHDRLAVEIQPQLEMVELLVDPVPGPIYCVVCPEFPDFYLESGVSYEDAVGFVDYFSLNCKTA